MRREPIPDDHKAMRELSRILTPDGFGIVLVENSILYVLRKEPGAPSPLQ